MNIPEGYCRAADLAERYGLHVVLIGRYLRAAGVPNVLCHNGNLFAWKQDEAERELAARTADMNQAEAARIANVSRDTIAKRMRKHKCTAAEASKMRKMTAAEIGRKGSHVWRNFTINPKKKAKT